jgi:hypothetical protein
VSQCNIYFIDGRWLREKKTYEGEGDDSFQAGGHFGEAGNVMVV